MTPRLQSGRSRGYRSISQNQTQPSSQHPANNGSPRLKQLTSTMAPSNIREETEKLFARYPFFHEQVDDIAEYFSIANNSQVNYTINDKYNFDPVTSALSHKHDIINNKTETQQSGYKYYNIPPITPIKTKANATRRNHPANAYKNSYNKNDYLNFLDDLNSFPLPDPFKNLAETILKTDLNSSGSMTSRSRLSSIPMTPTAFKVKSTRRNLQPPPSVVELIQRCKKIHKPSEQQQQQANDNDQLQIFTAAAAASATTTVVNPIASPQESTKFNERRFHSVDTQILKPVYHNRSPGKTLINTGADVLKPFLIKDIVPSQPQQQPQLQQQQQNPKQQQYLPHQQLEKQPIEQKQPISQQLSAQTTMIESSTISSQQQQQQLPAIVSKQPKSRSPMPVIDVITKKKKPVYLTLDQFVNDDSLSFQLPKSTLSSHTNVSSSNTRNETGSISSIQGSIIDSNLVTAEDVNNLDMRGVAARLKTRQLRILSDFQNKNISKKMQSKLCAEFQDILSQITHTNSSPR